MYRDYEGPDKGLPCESRKVPRNFEPGMVFMWLEVTFYRAYTKIANCLSSWNEDLAQHRSEICWVVGMKTSSRTAQKPGTFFCWSHVLDRENSQETRKMQSTKILPERAVPDIGLHTYIAIYIYTSMYDTYIYIYTVFSICKNLI